MCQLRKAVVRFVRHEEGPTAVEYAVMLAVIIVVCIAAITVLGTTTNGTYRRAGTAVNLSS
jgi:pilus assembly protein Flp/PilA